MPNNNEAGGDGSRPNNGGAFRVPPRTWIVWLTIFGSILVLMLIRDRWESPEANLPQWRFQQLLESNLIAQATVNYSPQMSSALEEQLFNKVQFEPREPNTMLMSILWSVLPIVVIAVLIWFFFIRQIRRVSRN